MCVHFCVCVFVCMHVCCVCVCVQEVMSLKQQKLLMTSSVMLNTPGFLQQFTFFYHSYHPSLILRVCLDFKDLLASKETRVQL